MVKKFLPIFSNIAIQLIGLVTGIIIARKFSSEGRGYIALITTLPSLLAYIFDLGIPASFLRHSENLTKGKLATFSGILVIVQTLMSLFVLKVVIDNTASYASYSEIMIFYTIAYVPISILTRYLQAFLMGRLNYIGSESIRISVPIVYSIALVVGILYFPGNIRIAIYANLISNAIALLVSIYFVMAQNFNLNLQTSTVNYYAFIVYGIRAHLSRLSLFSSLRIELIIIGTKFSLTALGLYVVALSVATVVRSLAGILGNMILAEMNKLESLEEKRLYFVSRVINIGIFGFPLFIFLMILIPFLLPILFGQSFRQAVPSAMILTLGSMLFIASQIITEALRSIDEKVNLFVAEIIGALLGTLILFSSALQSIFDVAIVVALSQLFALVWQIVIAFKHGLFINKLSVPYIFKNR